MKTNAIPEAEELSLLVLNRTVKERQDLLAALRRVEDVVGKMEAINTVGCNSASHIDATMAVRAWAAELRDALDRECKQQQTQPNVV